MTRRGFLGMLAACFAAPAWASAPAVNRALTAALAEVFRDPAAYGDIYQEYLGVAPRYVPSSVPTPWPSSAELAPLLSRGELRLGCCYNPPYHFTGPGGRHEGLDYDLGLALMGPFRRRYGGRLRLRWVEKPFPSGGDDQLAMYRAMITALEAGEIDAAMPGVSGVNYFSPSTTTIFPYL